MADAYSAALIQALQGERQRYAQQNPLISGGQALNGVNLYDADKGGWENAAVAALQGFGSGALQGIGNYMVDSQYSDLNNQMFQALSAEDPGAAMAGNPQLQQFAPLIKAQQMERQQSLADAQAQMGLQSAQELRKASILEDIKNPYREGAQERLVALGLTRSQPQGEPGVMSPVTDQASMGQPSQSTGMASDVKPTEFYLKQAQGDPTMARTLMERDLQSPDRQRSAMNTLREDFQKQKEVENFITADTGFRSLSGAMKDPYSTSDVEIVKSVVQAIEPGLAVNGGEVDAIQQSASIPENIKGQLLKTLQDGSALTDPVREGLFRIAKRRYVEHATKFKLVQDNVKARTEKIGGDLLDIGYLATYTPVDVGDPNSTIPKTMNVNGKSYELNPQTGKYRPVK